MCPTSKLIIRNKVPNLLIPVTKEQQISERFLTNIDQSNLADEIKCVVLTGQNAPNRTSPCELIVASPQRCNEVCDECESDILNMTNDDDNHELINISSDGSSSKGHLTKN